MADKKHSVSPIWKKALASVAAVFSSFGGFLTIIQPPQQAPSGFALGFALILSGIAFLAVQVFFVEGLIPVGWRKRSAWIVLCAAFVLVIFTGIKYQQHFVNLTFKCPALTTSTLVRGTELTQIAQTALRSRPRTDCDLLLDFGGEQEEEMVWTRSSLNEARLQLSGWYISFAVGVAASIFFLVELLQVSSQKEVAPSPPPADKPSTQGSAP